MKKMKASTLRALVMGVILVVVAIGYFTAVGIGNLSGFGFDVFAFLCPLGYLESLLASKIFVPRALISVIAVVLLIIVLGRVFCAWMCPMPFLQKIVPGLGKKSKKAKGAKDAAALSENAPAQAAPPAAGDDAAPAAAEASVAVASEATSVAPAAAEPTAQEIDAHIGGKPNRFKFDSRYGVLLGALGSAAIFGFPVFCLICPVGLTFAGVFLVMRLFAFGETTWAIIAVPLVLLLEVVFFRKWCSKICPLGAVISLISGANKTLRPTIDDGKCLDTSKGISCLRCAKSCPEHINIREPELSEVSLNNCTKCRECSDHCPTQAITFPFLPSRKGKGDAVEKE